MGTGWIQMCWLSSVRLVPKTLRVKRCKHRAGLKGGHRKGSIRICLHCHTNATSPPCWRTTNFRTTLACQYTVGACSHWDITLSSRSPCEYPYPHLLTPLFKRPQSTVPNVGSSVWFVLYGAMTTMCFLTVSSNLCLETGTHTLTAFSRHHLLDILWAGKRCLANRVWRSPAKFSRPSAVHMGQVSQFCISP